MVIRPTTPPTIAAPSPTDATPPPEVGVAFEDLVDAYLDDPNSLSRNSTLLRTTRLPQNTNQVLLRIQNAAIANLWKAIRLADSKAGQVLLVVTRESITAIKAYGEMFCWARSFDVEAVLPEGEEELIFSMHAWQLHAWASCIGKKSFREDFCTYEFKGENLYVDGLPLSAYRRQGSEPLLNKLNVPPGPRQPLDPRALADALDFVGPVSTMDDGRFSGISVVDGIVFAVAPIAAATQASQAYKALSTKLTCNQAKRVAAALRKLRPGCTTIRVHDGRITFDDGEHGFSMPHAPPSPPVVDLYFKAGCLASVDLDLEVLGDLVLRLDSMAYDHDNDPIEITFDPATQQVSLAIHKAYGTGLLSIAAINMDMPEDPGAVSFRLKRSDLFSAIQRSLLVPKDENVFDCRMINLRLLAHKRTGKPGALLAINRRIAGPAAFAVHTLTR